VCGRETLGSDPAYLHQTKEDPKGSFFVRKVLGLPAGHVSMEKKKFKTVKLIGPLPIPRKEEITPSSSPIKEQTAMFSI
jgi:hypothetical protein